MITEERITSFLRSLECPKSDVLEDIRKEALASGVPIIRLEEEALLFLFMELLQPVRVLEVGAAVGYSASLMAEHLKPGAHITTIENYPPRIEEAKKNIARTGNTEKITLLEGDATAILESLTGEFDLIFMDAAKAQYIVWLPEILRLLSPKGVLISDNVLQDGDVLESRFAVDRRDRTIHARMREYLYELKHRDDLQTSVIPLGDGVAVTVKKESRETNA